VGWTLCRCAARMFRDRTYFRRPFIIGFSVFEVCEDGLTFS
jgi:hypothetical protein